MSLPSLPREVIDRIIDTVAEDARCRETLRVCSQVAHVFVQRAHHHLFSHFRFPFLGEKGSAEALEMLLQVLRDSLQFPGIGIISQTSHIRDFHLFGWPSTEQTFVQEGHHLAAIFKLFHTTNRIRSLTIWLPMSFLRLGEECCASLIALCRSPNLKALTVDSLFDIPKYLLHGSHIKHIDFYYSEFLSYPSDEPKILYQPESIATHSSRFHSLLDAFHAGGGEIEQSTRYTEALVFLKKLTLTVMDVQDIPSCLNTASFAGAVLKEIELDMISDKDQSALSSPKSTPTYPFHYLPNLHILRLDFFYLFRRRELVVKTVREFLEFSILPPSLEELVLSVTFAFCATVGEDDFFEWNFLDAILTRSPFCAIPLVIFKHYPAQLSNSPCSMTIRWSSGLRDRLLPDNMI